MSTETRTAVPVRRDAARNRQRLLSAARRVFAELGPEAPLEEVARAAGVSRTTLYRNFPSREALAIVVMEDNVARIERRAEELRGTDDGIVALFDFVLDIQQEDRSVTGPFSPTDKASFGTLGARTADAFRPLLERGHRAGVVHPAVDLEALMLAYPMAAAVARFDIDGAARQQRIDRARALFHRALFTRPEDSAGNPDGRVTVEPPARGGTPCPF